MKASLRQLVGLALAASLAGCSHGLTGVAPNSGGTVDPASTTQTSTHAYFEGAVRLDGSAEVCARARSGFARCDALVRLDAYSATGPDLGGYGPADLLSAYKLPASKAGQTVAVVDAFDDPNAEADLGVYRSHYGLSACTTANGCFKKVNQSGHTSPLPSPNVGWAEEISLDVDMVSAICPACHILLVEATSSAINDLALSVDTAAALGANAISNSYGGPESGFSENSHYNHPGHMITVSAGDNSFGPQAPADSQYVTAVGGTRLVHATNTRGWKESAWGGGGSGCSTVAPKPAWQMDPLCSKRTIADVAAVADPSTGVVVYDSYGISPGFYVFGGTSVSSPIIAGVYALAGNASTLNYAQHSYANTNHLYDIKTGANGSCGNYLCMAEPGYDGPTGNGTPHGDKAF
jgi:subtilase family serine protease